MRNMSFSMTTEQIRDHSKTVTRRLGWLFLSRGDLVQPVEKAQGLKKGERVKKIGCPIRIVFVNRERLDVVTRGDIWCEGFRYLSKPKFISMFCKANRCSPDTIVTRIVFEYTRRTKIGDLIHASEKYDTLRSSESTTEKPD